MNGWQPITSSFDGELVYWSKPIDDTLRLSVKGARWAVHRREATIEYRAGWKEPRTSYGAWWRELEGTAKTSAAAKRAAEAAVAEWLERRRVTS